MARWGFIGDFEIDAERRGNCVARARGLLEHLAEGREGPAWEAAQLLAKGVLDDRRVALARAVLEAGPFSMRRAVELAELLMEEGGKVAIEAVG